MSRPAAAPARLLHMIGNAHIDPVWLWQWPEGFQEARSTFWSAIHRMAEYPDFVFTCDQVALLAFVEEADPALFEEIRKRVADGRWVNVGGWWVEPDCNVPTGESFVRQGLLGQRYLREKFGVSATVGLNADPFGHNATLPQILRKQGLEAYCFLRPGPHEAELPGNPFWWEAADGSRVLAYRIPHEYCSPRADIAYHTDKAMAQLPPGLGTAMVFYGVGNHGGGPTKDNIDSVHRLDRLGAYGELRLSSPPAYVEDVLASGVELPVWRGDLQHHAAGCYAAHSGIKAWMRSAEHALVVAERWASVASAVAGTPYPHEALTHAWKQVLFNQFHDILPGTSIEPAYDDARDQLGEARSIARRTVNLALQTLARDTDIPFREGTQPVLVFNPHPWRVRADVECEFGLAIERPWVEDDTGRPVPSQSTRALATTSNPKRVAFPADLPPLGHRLYWIRPGAQAPVSVGDRASEVAVTDAASAPVLENAHLRAEVDPTTGWLLTLLDKETGADLMAGLDGDAGVDAPHTVVTEDPTDTWGHRVVSYAGPGTPFTCTSARIVESGPVRTVVRVESTYGNSKLVEEIILGADARHLEVRVDLNWQEMLRLLKLRFPVGLREPSATYEIPYGHLTRPADGAEEPGQSWVDVSGTLANGTRAGLTVVNDAKSAYDVSGADIGITAARSPVYAWHEPRQLEPDGLYSYQDQGRQTFRYLLVPHAGDWRDAGVVRLAAELAEPAQPAYESFHPGPRPATASFAVEGVGGGSDGAGGSVVTTVLKRAEDGDALVVRAYESAGVPATWSLDLGLAGRTVSATFGPHEIKSFLVPFDPDRPVVETDLLEDPLAATEPATEPASEPATDEGVSGDA
ncbi:alpha-mannosidase [Actinopolymorpha rutila]|uniref:Alpha-mannosidase n=1 Tax=Actinopolymorpha rutila TaxID=446787 RepID=A0A852ZF26_9ACTN|nr:alpha-mannosidase [Actinopolymorpha rutila]NYH87570.1 alpha-mannosidase [Actinopolymorpha rutila]